MWFWGPQTALEMKQRLRRSVCSLAARLFGVGWIACVGGCLRCAFIDVLMG